MSLKDSFDTQRPRAEISAESGLPKIVIGRIRRQDVEKPSKYNDRTTFPASDEFVGAQMQTFEAVKQKLLSHNEQIGEHILLHAPFELRRPMYDMLKAEELLIIDKGLEERVRRQAMAGQEAVYGVYDYFRERLEDFSQMAVKASNLEHKIEALQEQSETDADQIEMLQGQLRMFQSIAQKKVEVQEVMNAYMGALRNHSDPAFDLSENTILVTPATNVGNLGLYRNSNNSWDIAGLINCEGNQMSHTAIVARAANLLRMVVDRDSLRRLKDGDLVIMDGIQGKLIVNPDEETLNTYTQQSARYRDDYLTMVSRARETNGKIYTADGQMIRVNLNIAYSDEISVGLQHGARRIGLYRTEIPALVSNDRIKTEEWSEIFQYILDQTRFEGQEKPAMVTLRTLDQSADKELRVDYMGVERHQIKAMYDALEKKPGSRACVLFPMVRGRRDFEEKMKIVEEEAEACGRQRLEVGAMIETPVAVNDMARMRADFYSVGTNDLYFGVQGDNRYDPQHTIDETEPSFLRYLLGARKNAQEVDKRISICGDMASDLRMLPVLIGLGYKEFSVGPSAVPGLSAYIKRLTLDECTVLANTLIETRSSAKRWAVLDSFNTDHGLSHEGIIDMHWVSRDGARDTSPDRHIS